MPRNLDAELERIRKRPENKKCPNCAAEDPAGFRNFICKFEQIVCSNCKMAHQAFSHRCKGVGMSTFTEEEVDRLAATSNVIVAKTWLAKLSRKEICRMAPRKEDKPEVWHQWIQRIYINKEFLSTRGDKAKKKKGSKKKVAVPSSSESESSSEGESSDGEAARRAEESRKRAEAEEAKRAAEAKQAAEKKKLAMPELSSDSESESSESSSEDEATKRRKKRAAQKAARAAEKAAKKEAAKAEKAAAKEAHRAAQKTASGGEEAVKAHCQSASGAGDELDDLLTGSPNDLLAGSVPAGSPASSQKVEMTRHTGDTTLPTTIQAHGDTKKSPTHTDASSKATPKQAPVFDLAAWASAHDDSD